MTALRSPLLIALVAGLSLGAATAWARNVITTVAGCKQEFGKGSKPCEACVKGGGRWTQHAARKGVWACE